MVVEQAYDGPAYEAGIIDDGYANGLHVWGLARRVGAVLALVEYSGQGTLGPLANGSRFFA
jgi:hypothetical protein